MKARLFCLAAGLLAAASLALPLWGFAMSAPQYPGETLHLQITRTGIAGDVHEIGTLQHYVGVQFPAELPELMWARRAIVVLAGLLFAGALPGGRAVGRAYRGLCAAAMCAFLLAAGIAVQARLYSVGHDRDPRAPIRSVRNFTPPIVGPVKVANFTLWSYPHAGAILLIGAAALSIAGARVKRGAKGGAGQRPSTAVEPASRSSTADSPDVAHQPIAREGRVA